MLVVIEGIIQHNFVPKLKKVHSTGSKYVANEFDRSPDILNNLTSGPLQHSESAKKLSSPAGLLNRDMSQKDTVTTCNFPTLNSFPPNISIIIECTFS